MHLIDTSDTAVAARANEAMAEKHERQLALHQARFGTLGQPMNGKQKQALKRELKQAAS